MTPDGHDCLTAPIDLDDADLVTVAPCDPSLPLEQFFVYDRGLMSISPSNMPGKCLSAVYAESNEKYGVEPFLGVRPCAGKYAFDRDDWDKLEPQTFRWDGKPAATAPGKEVGKWDLSMDHTKDSCINVFEKREGWAEVMAGDCRGDTGPNITPDEIYNRFFKNPLENVENTKK